MRNLEEKENQKEQLGKFLKKTSVEPSVANPVLEEKQTSALKQRTKLSSLLSRPQLTFADMLDVSGELNEFVRNTGVSNDVMESLEIEEK